MTRKNPGIAVVDTEQFLRDNATVPLLYVRLRTRPDTPQRWFFADVRADRQVGFEPVDGKVWVCVHGATVSTTNLLRNINWGTRFAAEKPWAGYFVIEADNASQAALWLKRRGYRIQHQIRKPETINTDTEREVFIDMPSFPDYQPNFADTEGGDGYLDPDITALQRTIERAQAKIDYLASLPDEPEVDEDGVAVIFFKKTFHHGGRTYDYAAIKSRNGRWNTTGPQSPKDYSWKQLVKWIKDGNDHDEILVADTWAVL